MTNAIVVTLGISHFEPKSVEQEETKLVVVATRPLDLLAKLTAKDVKLKRFPVSNVPAGVVCDLTEVIGKTLNNRVFTGQFISPSHLRSDKRLRFVDDFCNQIVSVLVENDEKNLSLDSLQASERISLSNSDRKIHDSLLVYKVDASNNQLNIMVTPSLAKLIEKLKSKSETFEIGKPSEDSLL